MMRSMLREQTAQKPTSSRVNMTQSADGRCSPWASYIAPSKAPTLPEYCCSPSIRVKS